jgi:hypothetical protein
LTSLKTLHFGSTLRSTSIFLGLPNITQSDLLYRLKITLEPLAIAANVTQAAGTRLDHVLVTLGNLYRIYATDTEIDEEVRHIITKSLEKRWAKCDQDAFIVAVFLNPYIRAHLFNKNIHSLSKAGLYAVVKRVYTRVFRLKMDQVPSSLFADYLEYYASSGRFSPDAMLLPEMKVMYNKEVRNPLPFYGMYD